MPRAGTKISGLHALSAAALLSPPAIQRGPIRPFVVAGIVRVVESALVRRSGLRCNFWSVPPLADPAVIYRRYRRHLAALNVAFQAATLSDPGLSRPRKAIYAARIGVVGVFLLSPLPPVVLHQSRRPIFPGLLGSFYAVGLLRSSGFDAPCFSWCAAGRGKAALIAAPSWSARAIAAMR